MGTKLAVAQRRRNEARNFSLKVATYDAMRVFLARLGRRVLKHHVHPHLLRPYRRNDSP